MLITAVPFARWFDKSTAVLRLGKVQVHFFCRNAATVKQSATKKGPVNVACTGQGQMAQMNQKIKSVTESSEATKGSTQDAGQPSAVADRHGILPETHSGVAEKIRTETESSQKATQGAILLQHLKDEVERLKTENTLLRQKLSRVQQH